MKSKLGSVPVTKWLNSLMSLQNFSQVLNLSNHPPWQLQKKSVMRNSSYFKTLVFQCICSDATNGKISLPIYLEQLKEKPKSFFGFSWLVSDVLLHLVVWQV
jgi:hypothetical protein